MKVTRRGLGGDLLLLWRSCLDVSVKSFSPGHIDTVVRLQIGSVFRVTGFYGHPKIIIRGDSWRMLKRLANNSRFPWILFGDFNEIFNWDDHQLVGNRIQN